MKKIDKFSVPETKEDKIKKLKEAEIILKQEYVGLDDIIDKVCSAITPWYVTPEVIARPTVISMWGMTGTGKTSIVRRLTSLLGLSNKTVFFDCGEESNQGNTTVASKISDILNIDEDNNSPSGDTINDFVFVFDEFQHARTINEHAEEIDKPNLRSFWNLVDTGILKSEESSWETSHFLGFVDDFEGYVSEYPNVTVDNGMITDKTDIQNLLNSLGFFYYDRGVPGLMGKKGRIYEDNDMIKDEDVLYAPLSIIDDRIYRIMVRRLKSNGSISNPMELVAELRGAKTTTEVLDILKEAKKSIIAPKEINCNKSLIFVLGNLDEAFKVEGDINPDIDADIFYDQTSKVTITDIKVALKQRFRAEQIARFGNSIIKYPTLNKENFKKVIKKEVSRISSEFKNTSGITLEISKDMYDLLYSEGVYPVQGVRPVFTTITSIFTPILSDIVMLGAGKGDTARLSIVDPESGYKLKAKSVEIEVVGKGSSVREIELTLGDLRRPDSKKTRYANAVHEIGHAVVMSYLTGELPIAVVAVGSDSGGFCITYNASKTGEISMVNDVDNNVMISMGGYLSEELIFPDKGMRLLGSGNDISEAWEELGQAAYNLGYFEPLLYGSYETYRGPAPSGIDDKYEIKERLRHRFEELRLETKKILASNVDLIKSAALKLGEVGEITGKEFLEFIKASSGSLNEERLEEAKKKCSYEHYKELLLKK